MHPITVRHLSSFEEILSEAMYTIGASESLSVVFVGDTYYAVSSHYLEHVLDQYKMSEKNTTLLVFSYFAFRFITERTLLVLKTRVPLDFLRTRLERHRYIVVDDTTTIQ
jgi:hypothetical protein